MGDRGGTATHHHPLRVPAIIADGRSGRNRNRSCDRRCCWQLLMERGATLDFTDYRGTLLHYAVAYGNSEISEALLDQRADAKDTDSDGKAPCQLARDKGGFTGASVLDRLCRPQAPATGLAHPELSATAWRWRFGLDHRLQRLRGRRVASCRDSNSLGPLPSP